MADELNTGPVVLLVDDISANLFATSKVLEPLGITVETAMSGEKALAVAIRHDLALAILDVQMPGMDGFELAELLRDQFPRLPIIFLTAMDRSLAGRGFKSGGVDYLSKPIDPDRLRDKVSFYLNMWRTRAALRRGA